MRTKILKEKRDESIHRILDAAMEVFAEVGYEGARVDEIAKRAGVNKAMIYYHNVFGDTAERISENIQDAQSQRRNLRSTLPI
jgi:TetR/AcrR family transcriptional regulator